MQNRILGSAKMEQTYGTCIIFIFNDRKNFKHTTTTSVNERF